jgi:hypothetical protein
MRQCMQAGCASRGGQTDSPGVAPRLWDCSQLYVPHDLVSAGYLIAYRFTYRILDLCASISEVKLDEVGFLGEHGVQTVA